MIPGEIIPADGDLELNADRRVTRLTVANTGDRPIQVGSHYHFAETNPALHFDRGLARGCRLDLHPRQFAPGRATTTMVGHINCLVHQTDAAPAYELTVFSTLAATFLDWLVETAAEDGAEIV